MQELVKFCNFELERTARFSDIRLFIICFCSGAFSSVCIIRHTSVMTYNFFDVISRNAQMLNQESYQVIVMKCRVFFVHNKLFVSKWIIKF